MAPIVSDPYIKLFDRIAAQAAILAIVGQNYGKDFAPSATAFPGLSWREMSLGKGKVDVEAQQYHADRVQFDLWGGDVDQLRALAILLDDALEDCCWAMGRPLDTTQYRCNLLKRDGDWRLLQPAGLQLADGSLLRQLSSDWRFIYVKKQAA